MTSIPELALIDLERDLPTTREDTEALRKIKMSAAPMSFEELQRLVDSLPAAACRQRRTTSEGWPEFEL